MDQAKEFFRALIPLKIRWVSQASINAAHDEEFLQLIKASGCQALLIGFETLNPENLQRMRKGFNLMNGGYEKALENLRRHGIRLYATFILGYDEDNGDTLQETLAFAERHRFYIVAFNHLTPFPGTPLYKRLRRGRPSSLRPLVARPGLSLRNGSVCAARHDAGQVKQRCIEARRKFYSFSSIFRRSLDFKSTAGTGSCGATFSPSIFSSARRCSSGNFPLGDEAVHRRHC